MRPTANCSTTIVTPLDSTTFYMIGFMIKKKLRKSWDKNIAMSQISSVL